MSKYTEQIKALEASKCKACNGRGRVDLTPTSTRCRAADCPECPDCNGTGVVIDLFTKFWKEEWGICV